MCLSAERNTHGVGAIKHVWLPVSEAGERNTP
ncbi:hypothetical protein GKJPGBOP_05298 [Streptomyces paromomycinus]|uniref:Uncharacterized protein n=1 Tax=Streptomyces paromomycinus TaxID=92743 RepID=A0A401W8B5_STREY|nr:hypothetical protein GKJPGBOP_05298 [Streptomyces paromomycinus]